MVDNAKWFRSIYPPEFYKHTVAMKLDDQIMTRLSTNARRNYRKAKQAGIEVVNDNSQWGIQEFSRLYRETMNRLKARSGYYFRDNYYRKIVEQSLGDIYLARYGHQIIGAILVLKGKVYLHNHLTCSDHRYAYLSPSTIINIEVAKWGAEHGYSYYHLGGGVSEGRDGLFHYKKSLNKLGELNLYMSKKIWNPLVYDRLVVESGGLDAAGSFFPAYRGR